ncbi:hypothetical protein Y032_0038g3613 [Ancylostoma ceylanicum]|uniref:Uncharacterized protein n=1 Tax=Ancylostoma ceylanicum TaxID=53326 RepID=A0A016UIU2_9BILA|nr:hypothetical protein Y032_0038g3613 [Ancylostoma ceylanicum]
MGAVVSIHHQAVAAYDSRTNERVNHYLDEVNKAPHDPGAAARRLFLLAYVATQMHMPRDQFPTLCTAVYRKSVQIGSKNHTRDGFVGMTELTA